MEKNLSDLMKQAQAMQGKLQEAQKKIENLTITGNAGANAVTIEITGRHEVKKVSIDNALLKENNKEVLEDLIRAAFNDAIKKAEKASREQMMSIASGLNIPSDMLSDKDK